MQFLTRLLGFAVIAILVTAQEAPAQTIDCNDAFTPDETTVCARRGLKRLDRNLGELFEDVVRDAPRNLRYMIREQQAAWVRARNRCRTDRRCIRAHYQARIRELNVTLGDDDDDPQAPAAPQPPAVVAGCTIFEHFNYRGRQVFIQPNTQQSFFATAYDNMASSVRISGQCRLRAFRRATFSGRDQTYQADTSQFGGAMNERISSVQCLCR